MENHYIYFLNIRENGREKQLLAQNIGAKNIHSGLKSSQLVLLCECVCEWGESLMYCCMFQISKSIAMKFSSYLYHLLFALTNSSR